MIHKESEDSFMNELEGNLSELERKVLYLHLLGTDYRTIAKLLGKSPKAVDNALQRIKTKAEELDVYKRQVFGATVIVMNVRGMIQDYKDGRREKKSEDREEDSYCE